MDVTKRKLAEVQLIQQKLNEQKMITQVTLQAEEKERTELGKELHDNINQLLATSSLYLSIYKNTAEDPKGLLAQAYEYIIKAISEIRNLSHIVNGLDIEFVNELNGHGILNKDKELALYRIAQEQINNIRKYSGAKKVNIVLKEKSNYITLCISDNGIGFDASKKSKGIGLRNIKSRVEFYSGKMHLVTAPGSGCKLVVMIPAA
jgi:two-component system sensor histidine kinase UhpB